MPFGMTPAPEVARDPDRLAALDEYDILDTVPEAEFDDLVTLACHLCAAPIGLISFVDRDRQWFKARHNFALPETDLGHSVCAHAVARGELLVIEDLAADPRTCTNPLVIDEPAVRFYAGAPLITPAGQVLGTICVIDHQPRPGGLRTDQAEDLVRLARQVMGLLEMRRVLLRRSRAVLGARRDSLVLRERLRASEAEIDERRSSERRQEALIAIGDALHASGSREASITAASRLLVETLGTARAGVGLRPVGADHLDIIADWVRPGLQSLVGRHKLCALRGAGGLRPGRISVRRNAAAEAGGAQIAIGLREQEPLEGVLFVQSDGPRDWSRAEMLFVQSVADRLSVSLAKRAALAKRELLARELEHRMKNTLSVVQALAAQTLRGLDDRGALDRLMRRLQALGKAHEVLLQESWSSAPIRPLVEASLALHGMDGRFEIAGPEMMLSPRATLSTSLLLHELGTNACKYGALSVPTGQVSVVWHIERPDDGDPVFVLGWCERGGPPARAPQHNGFGSRLIRAGLVGIGGGTLDYAPEGLTASFTAPVAAMTDAS
jgi:two-component sensor histidine kinase